MRVLLGAAAMALLITSSAWAQTGGATPAPPAPPSTCAAVAPAPTLPDGASADREAMAAGNTAYTAWAETAQASLGCRRAEAEALRVQWQARVAEHNTAAETLNTAGTSWEAEVAEYNERNPQRRSGLSPRN